MNSSGSTKRPIQAIILDAGGIILHPNLDWIIAQGAEQNLSLSLLSLFHAYYRTILEVDRGDSPSVQGAALTNLQIRIWFITRMLINAGVPALKANPAGQILGNQALAKFPRESDIYHWAMPGTREQLERLRSRFLTLGVASNNDGALREQLKSVGVEDLFDVLLDSGIEGVAKPEPELLLRAARALEVPAENCLYIGDVDRVDGRAARAANMAFVLLDPLLQSRTNPPMIIPSLDVVADYFTTPEASGYSGLKN